MFSSVAVLCGAPLADLGKDLLHLSITLLAPLLHLAPEFDFAEHSLAVNRNAIAVATGRRMASLVHDDIGDANRRLCL